MVQIASSGGRRLEPAAAAAGKLALEDGRTVTRKELSEAFRVAAKALDLSASERMLLGELIACWGEHAWERVLVWPSNQWLAERTGLAERSIRNVIGKLARRGLLVPKDSANGKRFAVRDATGAVVDAYGFDLTPLFARRGEWLQIAAAQAQLKKERQRHWDEITAQRRAALSALQALAHHFPDHDREELEAQYAVLSTRTPERTPKHAVTAVPEGLLDLWKTLRDQAETAVAEAGNDGQNCRHIESASEPSTDVLNKGFRKVVEETLPSTARPEVKPPNFELADLYRACPIIAQAGLELLNIRDVVDAGAYFFQSLGAHRSAWREAAQSLSPPSAAIVAIYVAQLLDDDISTGDNRIRNVGGYFRTIVRLVEQQKLDMRKELHRLALKRNN